MSVDTTVKNRVYPATPPTQLPEFETIFGHPKPLWMLFMAEFWERFAFYGIRWALTLYIVTQFFDGNAIGEGNANSTYGAYLALVYASAIFGGFIADRIIGYQRSIIIGAVIMACGLFLITVPSRTMFEIGLATIVIGNGLFKPNISSLVGQLYAEGDTRRDRGFTIFYMGINAGSLISPLITSWLAGQVFGTPMQQNYKVVFIASGIGMFLSLLWFWIGKRQLKGVGLPSKGGESIFRTFLIVFGSLLAIPLAYLLLAKLNATTLAWILGLLFAALATLLIVTALRNGKIQRDRVIAMLIIFVFNVMFWMFFEQAGSSFNFLAKNIVDRQILSNWEFPVGWFQSVNPLAIILLAPIIAVIWSLLDKYRIEPSIPRKFSLGLMFNGFGFLILMYALSNLLNASNMIPFWSLIAVYVIQTVGELCLSPIGLSMVTKLAPVRLVGFAMGGWFLSTAIGNNLSGVFASFVSGEEGMTVSSALRGYTFGFWSLIGSGILLFLISPLINRLMHGVK
ncbi:peptide MFS transporter [Xylella fastidiosa]|uniref:Peptide MFS transporter n=1 Tax=Xylella fastidiosa subsp. multiplex TaxID=644357 RepID=A0AAW6HWS6_XYLFS|nr:peptide MFS transporter [Xylella fastidiosa]KFA40781.1 di-tripeptide ABC transporter membrane protein [Xylella fastidiosa]MBS9446159.1 peptide MFS transporter [Xylella fastidiosa subsp. multiplex]MBS9448198.1 peptide MFS transporter [Xylella fastidiosa subsp. multiplex]MBS9450177.1 peptide MFS transporter [Xylella fastidiosa subsp. multiplex]MBS9452130.1 peptide MFS transporter [Xylella fastidiosa subsp. multiplex]